MPSKTRVHICFGDPGKHYENLKRDALRPAGQVFDWWNITMAARPGDMVIIYMVAPISAFVATAVIDSIGKCPDESSTWCDKPCAWLRDAKMLSQEITRDQVMQHFPEWRFLKRPTATCIPNKNTPADLVDRFLTFLEVANPIAVRYAEATDIEGIKSETRGFTRTRSRHLRDIAFDQAKGTCSVCKRDFSTVLDGRGVRVLQVHHRQQLSATDAPSVTSLSDLAVVCANCHMLLHLDSKKSLEVETLQKMLQVVPIL